MAITSSRVGEIFKGLESGDGAAFFEHVAEDVDWIVEGTHPPDQIVAWRGDSILDPDKLLATVTGQAEDVRNTQVSRQYQQLA